jgi:hypothetical protein
LEYPEANVAVACYNENGKMLQYAPLPYRLLMEQTFSLPKDTAYSKIFFTDDNWRPIASALTMEE